MPTSQELEELAEDVERLTAVVSIEDIADAWWRYTLRAQDGEAPSENDADWWAVYLWVNPSTYEHESFLRAGLRALADRAPDGADLGYLGAGPVENFVTDDEDRLRWIEREAKRSENFRSALANVWIDDVGLTPEAFERVETAAGQTLRRTPRR